jgi:hypothetical protein
MDLHATFNFQVAQNRANGWMRDLINGLTILNLRIDYTEPVLKERREVAARQVAVLIYGGSEHRATVLTIPGRIVSSTTEERDAKGCSADDHGFPVIVYRL